MWRPWRCPGHIHHAAARDWWEKVDEPEAVLFAGLPSRHLSGFNAAVLAAYGNPPLTNDQAWEIYETLLADDRIVLKTDEPAGLESQWKRFALRPTASPKLWMDAYLAAFAFAEGCQMVTTDHAFKQFHGLDLHILD